LDVNKVTRHKSAIPYGIAALHGLLDRNSISFVNKIFFFTAEGAEDAEKREKREKRELGRNPAETSRF